MTVPSSATTDSDNADRVSWLPVAWAGLYLVVMGTAFYSISWALNDTYAQLATADRLSWRAAVVDAFTRGVEYRPLFTLGVKAAYDTVGTWRPFYQTLVLLQFGALLATLVWLCRPVGWRRGLAACLAVSCVAGLHPTRILFGFWPLNHHSAVMVLVLLAVALACDPRTRPIDWVYGPLALIAMLGIELGLLIVPLSLVLWWFKAPGIGRRGVAAVLVAAGLYLAVRLALSSASGELSVYADSGFGFQSVDAETLRQRFGDRPWIFWGYNVAATFLTVVASEPRDGVYQFVESILARDMETWQWFQVGVSSLTTLAIAAGLLWARPTRPRDRLLVVAGLSLLCFGSLLGFLYARDRIGLAGGVGYALLLYVAAATCLERASSTSVVHRTAAGIVAIIGLLWVVRSGELFFQLRDTAWDYHGEWTRRFDELAGGQPPTRLLGDLKASAAVDAPVDPRLDPSWTYWLFERRFKRLAAPEGTAPAPDRP